MSLINPYPPDSFAMGDLCSSLAAYTLILPDASASFLSILFCSDLGLCGAYNQNMMKLARDTVRKEDPMVVFNVQHGAKVMAAGKGTVVKVESDEEFGNRVVIDHGNGYFTIYRYNDAPKVKEGDDVSIGQLLFEVNYVSSKVGYQMMYDEEYINPMDVMEING